MPDLKRTVLILAMLTIGLSIVHSACICRESEPPPPIWEAPCGVKIKDDDFDLSEPAIDPAEKRAMIRKSLKVITQNLNLSIYFYKRNNFTRKNDEIAKRLSSSILQDVDGWLPTSQKVREIKVKRIREIPKVQLVLYNMLQKYAMIFDLMLNDDHDKEKQDFAKRTTEYLKSLLCEVQSALIGLQEKPVGAPEKIPERYLSSQKTDIHVRDADVISKYGQFLVEWRRWIRRVRRELRRRKQKKNGKSAEGSKNVSKEKRRKNGQNLVQ